MLRQVLHAIESTNGPVHVAELSQRLGIERSALEGMITYWVQKGRLHDEDATDDACEPSPGHCRSSCSGTTNCAFIAKMPKSYSIRNDL